MNGACPNGLSLHLPALDAAILATLKTDVLTEEIVEAVVTRTIELARLEPDEHAARRQALLGERQRLEGEIRNLTEDGFGLQRIRLSEAYLRQAEVVVEEK